MSERSMTRSKTSRAPKQRGFSLIELMIAMLLGLIVSLGVAAVFIANQKTYRTTQALAEVQDSTRVAFDALAHDIRNSQLTGCNNNTHVANVLKNSPNGGGTDWWANWGNTIHGYDASQVDPAVTSGTTAGQRIIGQSSIQIIGADDTVMSVQAHNATSNQITINGSPTLSPLDVVIVCDPDHATLLKITSYTAGTNGVIKYDATNNCSTGLGYPTVCVAAGTPYTFGANAQLSKLTFADWFISNNSVGGTSLYRIGPTNPGTGTTPAAAQEMVRGVSAMTITYHQSGAALFTNAAGVTSWPLVDAVQLKLTMASTDTGATTAAAAQSLSRIFTGTVTLRNRVN